MPRMGTPLRGEWAGDFGIHFGRDTYRLVYTVDAEREAIVVLRVSPKKTARGTVYDEPRPDVE